MIAASQVSAFGKGLTPTFTAYLWKAGCFVGKVSGSDKSFCRIAETARKVGACFRKYTGNQGVKPLSKPQVKGTRICH